MNKIKFLMIAMTYNYSYLKFVICRVLLAYTMVLFSYVVRKITINKKTCL